MISSLLRQRAGRLMIQCPLLSITAVARERLRPGGGRAVESWRPGTVEWSHLVVGGRPGLRRGRGRGRGHYDKVNRVPSYVNILMTCA